MSLQTFLFMHFNFFIPIPLSCCCSKVLSNVPLGNSCLNAVLANARSVVLLNCTVVTCQIKRPLQKVCIQSSSRFLQHEVTRSVSSPPWMGSLAFKLPSTHLYTWVKRGNVRVQCLAEEHNVVPRPRLKPRPPDPEPSVLSVRRSRLPPKRLLLLMTWF